MVENKYGIGEIEIECKAKCFCPLGNDWYTNQFTIMIVPDKKIPDYCEVDAWIERTINGKTMIIEAAVDALHKHIVEGYEPKECRVVSYVDDAKHSTVTVCKG